MVRLKIALSLALVLAYPAHGQLTCDGNGDGKVTIAELVTGVNNALAGPTPTPEPIDCGFGCADAETWPEGCNCAFIYDCTVDSLCTFDDGARFEYCFGQIECLGPRP